MKCRYCGRQIPDGMLYCEYCGKEVRIVPDYNPLDDMLTEQVKVSILGDNENDYLEYASEQEYARTKNSSARRNTGRTNTDREQRRRKAERKRALKRKRRNMILVMLLVFVMIVTGISVLIYQNSYTGIVKKGYKAIQTQEYDMAIGYFQKAIAKNDKKPDAYEGLSKVYIKKNDYVKAEDLFLKAIESQPKNSELYEACIQFYLNTEQEMEIPKLLENAEDSIIDSLAEYVVDVPQFSLDADQTYDDVQQLSLETNDTVIYYTTDETEPTLSSTKYTEPIQLGEGETIVKAIAVNKKGVPSATVTKTYVIEFPMVDAPAVSPSTGQYEEQMTIEIKVPEGYDAYYTTTGDNPTTASTKYTGPIHMPEGEILFKAVLVDASGRMSGVTTRNYVLDLPNDEE